MTPTYTEKLREEFRNTFPALIGKDVIFGGLSGQHEQVEDFWLSKFDQAIAAERGRVVAKVEKSGFKMNVDEYLPMVKAWKGGYDVPFDDGYKTAKRDILALLHKGEGESNGK